MSSPLPSTLLSAARRTSRPGRSELAALGCDPDANDRRSRFDLTVANPNNIGNAWALCVQICARFLQLTLRLLSLEREQDAILTEQRKYPPCEASQRSDCASRDNVCTQFLPHLFGSSPMHGHVLQAESLNALSQKDRPTEKRFKEDYREIRSHDTEHHTGKTRSGSDVNDFGTLGDQLLNNSTVHQVPFPQPRHLSWTDQPRTTPASARRSAYRAILGRASPNSACACSGGATRPPAPEVISHHLGLFVRSSTHRHLDSDVEKITPELSSAQPAYRRTR